MSSDEEKYNQTMMYSGIYYISLTSLFCIFPMLADLFNGFCEGRFWFPPKYFSLNVVSITAINVLIVMKLPMGLYIQGQVAKLGSMATMAFMSTMVANMLPSLGYMDNKTLVDSVIGFTIPIILVIVDSFMEFNTGVISHVKNLAYTLIAMLVFLLIILISAAIAIPSLKQILEARYQATSQRVSRNQRPEDRFNVEKLREYVKIHLILAETCDPQFALASSPLSSTSGLICLLVLIIYIPVAALVLITDHERMSGSRYRWWPTITIQSIGVVVGSIAPICRYFTATRLETSAVFKVEEYWTLKLSEWKESRISFLSNGRSRNVIFKLKNHILSLWIGFQKGIVVMCQIIGIIPIHIVVLICVAYCYFMSL